MKIEFYNELHLGDCLYQLLYCNKLVEKNNNIEIVFYCNEKYFYELNLWNKFLDKIFFLPIEKKTSGAYNTWIGLDNFHHSTLPNYNFYFDKQYIDFFNKLSKKINIENPIKTSEDFLFDNIEILKPTESYDFLIVNSKPLSGQVDKEMINYLENKIIYDLEGKIITTKKIGNFKCTVDYNYSLLDIAKISNNVKYIIGIHTSPMLVCLNKYSLNNFVKMYILQNENLTYSYNNKIFNINNLSEMKKIICE